MLNQKLGIFSQVQLKFLFPFSLSGNYDADISMDLFKFMALRNVLMFVANTRKCTE